MTRKDYVLIAYSLNRSRPTRDTEQSGNGDSLYHIGGEAVLVDYHARLCGRVADHLAADNPRFDRARFLKACGVTR